MLYPHLGGSGSVYWYVCQGAVLQDSICGGGLIKERKRYFMSSTMMIMVLLVS